MEDAHEKDKKLHSFQSKIDKQYRIYAKNDYNMKLTFYNSMKSILKERDDFISDLCNNGANFWGKAAISCQQLLVLLPEEEELPLTWIESIKCSYEDNYVCKVEITLLRNQYLNNRKLIKTFNLIENSSEGTELKIKKESNCLFFNFFRDNDHDLEVFDILFDFYVNAVYYFIISNDSQ